eukprot:3062250-Lingulodinium_polyedra.AAC.1
MGVGPIAGPASSAGDGAAVSQADEPMGVSPAGDVPMGDPAAPAEAVAPAGGVAPPGRNERQGVDAA